MDSSQRARRLLDQLHERAVNFDVAHWDRLSGEPGWRTDDYAVALPPEAPGPPHPDGSWKIGCALLHDYEFADPDIIPVVHYVDGPLDARDMVLTARFWGLRFHLGVRIGGVVEGPGEVEGRPVERCGWSYRTLRGHLESGQMEYLIVKYTDSGEVEFRIHVVSRPARIPNPVLRLGFRLFGRRMQVRFARRALARMQQLVGAAILARDRGTEIPKPARTLERIVVERQAA